MKILSQLSNWYFAKKALPCACVLAVDSLIVVGGGYLGVYVGFDGGELISHFLKYTIGIVVALLIFWIFFHHHHTYRGIIRYSSFVDLKRCFYAVLSGSIATIIVGYVVNSITSLKHYILMPNVIGVITLFFFSTLAMWVIRIVVKILFDIYRNEDITQKAFIYGVREGGVAIAKVIQNETPKRYQLAGFIRPEDDENNDYLMDRRIYKDDDKLIDVLLNQQIKIVIVSPLQTEYFREREDLINQLINNHIRIIMVPERIEWDGKSSLESSQLREVEIEDLLPRDTIEVNMDAIGSLLKGKKILITGAAGSIGSEMVRQIAIYHPAEMILIDQAETPMHDISLMMSKQFPEVKAQVLVSTITDKGYMEYIFSKHQPEYVFHAAAYKHVPMMEDNPVEAVRNNINGTRIIADLAVKYGTKKFVMISTDKAVNPTNVMGCSKRICEIYCQALNKAIQDGTCPIQNVDGSLPETQFITTRFGNVLGSNGSVIPLFREQIKKGGPITVTHPDIIRFFMLIPEACKLVLEAGTMGKGGEIFVFDMGKPVKIVDLAKRMIALSGAKDIKIEFSGLRYGEKLYEEVLSDKESTMPTVHPNIMVASVREYPYELALKNEQELSALCDKYDNMQIVAKMKEIVPEYKSQNSIYEKLDK